MHIRIGLLGIGLVAAFVVGGVANGPPYPLAAEESIGVESVHVGPSAESTNGHDFANLTAETAKSGPQAAAAGELIGFNGFDASGSQTITLVHTGKMQMAVYHIDRSGIHLVSSRPIDADFSLSLNVTAPLPDQIRLLGGQAK